MSEEKKMLEFVKKIVKESNGVEEAVKKVRQFRELLVLTKTANASVLKTIDEIIKGLPDGYSIYKILEDVKEEKKPKRKSYEDRHYDNYHTTHSSGCYGSRVSVSTSCGGGSSSYSSSCGGGSSYTSRC